jgi:pimeloyl-ACP methyl ester carboxylesterase
VADKAFELWGRPMRLEDRWGVVGKGARAFVLDTGTHSLAAWEWNSGGPAGTALLVHGWSGNASQLRAFVEPLVAKGFHVVAADLPAHGRTEGKFATLPLMADTVESLTRRLTPKLIVAHSLGATATAYALTKGMQVERLVLLAPAVEMPPYLRHFATQVGLSTRAQDKMIAKVEAIIGKSIDELDLRRHAAGWGAVKALVVHDEDDVVTPHAVGKQLADTWPGARFIETRGHGHDGIRKAREVVEQAVAFATGAKLAPVRGTEELERLSA